MYFPLFVDLTGRKILVAGGGRIAARRVRTLCAFSPQIIVIAPAISDEIRTLWEAHAINLIPRTFLDSDLDGVDFALAATDDADLNCRIGLLCRKLGIPVNVCSDQTLCDFQFPSVIRNGEVVIGVNASGTAHRLVKQTRQEIEEALRDKGFQSTYGD